MNFRLNESRKHARITLLSPDRAKLLDLWRCSVKFCQGRRRSTVIQKPPPCDSNKGSEARYLSLAGEVILINYLILYTGCAFVKILM
jgi:hypothetical protein